MTPTEKTYFEDLRQKKSGMDEKVVEHILFLKQLESAQRVKKLKHTMNSVEAKLMLEGVIQSDKSNFETKIVNLWRRYKTHHYRSCSRGRLSFHCLPLQAISSLILKRKAPLS